MKAQLVNPTQYTLSDTLYAVLNGDPLVVVALFVDSLAAAVYSGGVSGSVVQPCTLVD